MTSSPARPSASKEHVLANLEEIRAGIAAASDRAGRSASAVRLVAVTKTVEAGRVRWVAEAGIADFGENYVRELASKREAAPEATWHFIGTLQSHTARHVAQHADVVETLTPGSATIRLANRAAEAARRIQALIEVDFTDRRTGVPPERLDAFTDEVAALEGLELKGLMTLPPLPNRSEDSRPYFARLRELGERLRERHPAANQLSMGMSIDYMVAVEEGATMVRIGTALFGERPPKA